MPTPRRKSLVWRVGLGLIIVETILALLVGTYTYQSLRRFHYEQTHALLENICHGLSLLCIEPLASNDRQQIADLAEVASEQTDLRITLIALDGEVLGDSHEDPFRMDNHADRTEIKDALRGEHGFSSRFGETLQQHTFYFARAVEHDGQRLGVLRVARSIENIDRQLASIVQTFALGGIIWIILTILAVVIFSARLSAAIVRVGAQASEIAAGDDPHPLLVPPGKEFQLLADSLNKMASQLGERVAQLRTGQREQVAILRSMDSGVIALDQNRRILRLNLAAERMLETTEMHARGNRLEDLSTGSRLASHVDEAFQTREATTDELEISARGTLVVRAASSVLREPDGQAVGLLVMLTDITRLRRLESMRTDFAANVSHELRTPITNIQGYADTLLNATPDDPIEQREFLSVIARNAARLSSIVEDLLALARLEREEFRTALDVTTVPIARVIETVLQDVKVASTTDTEFRIEVDSGVSARANEHLVEQALMNLITNAVRHNPHDKPIVIKARPTTLEDGRPATEIIVEDQGPGIASEHIPRLFERFFRVDQARSRHEGGTGLGLAIVKHIALVHGGVADVQSTVGEGSSFRIVLPAI